jgi:two-component system chemotaxis response regulator CheY
MPKILVVDDSDSLREQVKKSLEQANHTVIEGADGILGYEALRAHPDIDLVISDINMPNLDGLAMCEKIRNDPNLGTKYPIFMMTTESNPDLKARGKTLGILAWVTKPFDHSKLLLAIEKVLAKKPT